MKKIVSGAEMKEIDRRAIEEFKIPSLTLMENAGRGVAEVVAATLVSKPSIVVIFCGKGNNGGDGLVSARYLAQEHGVRIFLLCSPSELKSDALANLMRLPKSVSVTVIAKNESVDFGKVQKAHLLVDALFGIGLKSDLEEPYRSAVDTINQSGKPVVSIDIPSGLDADTGEVRGVAVKATVTATLGLAKKGLYQKEGPRYSGEIRIVDIGIPKEAYE